MKISTPFILVFSFCYSFMSYGQYSYFEFESKLNSLITKKKNEAPIVFEIVKKNITVNKSTQKKVDNPEYQNINIELRKLLNDSIQTAQINKNKLDTYNQKNKIKELLNKYLVSKEGFSIKKQKLIDAQLIAKKMNLNWLIYADDKINTTNKSKFFVLKLNHLDLKVHLKKIVWKINSENKKPIIESPKLYTPKKVNTLRDQLNITKPYKYIKGPIKPQRTRVLALGTEITNPDGIINGMFKNLGEYYVIQKKIKGKLLEQLISVEKVARLNSKKLNFVFDITATLLQKVSDQKLYLTASGFIDEYSLTKLSDQKKFKNKVKLPFKIYSTVNDRLIDSIILNHNKSRLTMK